MSSFDLDRTIEFILQSQARAEARHERAEARQDKLDRRVDSIAKIVQQGMRMLVKLESGTAEIRTRQKRTEKTMVELAVGHKRMQAALTELARAQRSTERTLKAFVNSMRGGRNGSPVYN